MFNVGGGEVLVILVLALVVLGPNKLPEAARTFGKHLGDFRRMSSAFRAEINQAMDLGSFTGASATEPAAEAAAVPEPTPEPNPEPASAPAPVPPSAAPVAAAAAAPAWRPTPPSPAPSPETAAVDDDRSSTVWADGPVDSFV